MGHPNPVAFTIFGVDIRWYGIIIGLGFLIAFYISYKKARSHHIEPDYILDLTILLIPLTIIGARAYYVIFSWKDYQGNLREIFNIRNGGLAIHGGLITGILIIGIFCLIKKVNIFNLGDLIVPQVALAQAIGRWGNFFNGEAHGGPTKLPWGILVDGTYVHPTFLYESLWCFFLFIFLTLVDRKRRFFGQVTLLYGILYSVERFFVEGFRTDSLMIGNYRQAQVISLFIIIICLVLYIIRQKKNKHYNKNRRK